jgi:hypothetical protein
VLAGFILVGQRSTGVRPGSRDIDIQKPRVALHGSGAAARDQEVSGSHHQATSPVLGRALRAEVPIVEVDNDISARKYRQAKAPK